MDGTAGDGQGTPDAGGIFDSYLSNVPETWDDQPQGSPREVVSQYLKDAEKNVNSRLAEAADIQKKFGSYKDIDFSGFEPQLLSDVLEWHRSMNESPESYNNWLAEAAREAGIGSPEEEAQQYSDLSPQQIQALVQQASQSQIAPLQQQLEQFQQQQQTAALEREIDGEFSAIEAEHKLQLTDDQKQAIVDLGGNHEGDDWIKVGFDRLQQLSGAAQADLVNSKIGQPKPSLSAGSQEAPSPPKDIKEVEAMARERFRQSLAG